MEGHRETDFNVDRVKGHDEAMSEQGASDVSVVTPFGWCLQMRELGDNKLLLTWGDKHALVIEMKQ